MHIKSPHPALAAAVAAVLLLAGCSSKTEETPAAEVKASNVTLTAAQRQHIVLFTVEPAQYRKLIETTGAVDFDNDRATSILAPFSGPVTQVLVSPGQQVTKGQALAVVSSADFAAAVGAYSKALSTARNARRLADVDKDLLAHDGISRREAEQAQADAASADADRDAARQALVALDPGAPAIRGVESGGAVSRGGGVIRSPISGTLVEKLIAPGQLLQAGTTPCFTVADLSQVWVSAQVSTSDLSAIRLHDPAEVDTGVGSVNLHGTVDNISAIVDPDTRAVVARVVVANPGDLLKKQMYVGVRIQSQQADTGLLVPVSAILRDDENLPFVYVALPGGSFARQHVTLGYRDGDRYDIPAGLQPGTRVVADGAIFLQFMQSQ